MFSDNLCLFDTVITVLSCKFHLFTVSLLLYETASCSLSNFSVIMHDSFCSCLKLKITVAQSINFLHVMFMFARAYKSVSVSVPMAHKKSNSHKALWSTKTQIKIISVVAENVCS